MYIGFSLYIYLQLLNKEEFEKVHNRAKSEVVEETLKMPEVCVKYKYVGYFSILSKNKQI